jgi:mRNA interferase RelE/StbE
LASNITYKASVTKDLRRFDLQTARRVVDKLERALSSNPDAGIPLPGEFRGLFKLRVGDVRVIYAKTPDGVLVLRIARRKEAYRQ